MVQFGVPGQNKNPLAYTDNRLSTVPCVQASRRPLTTDKAYPIWTEWRVSKNPSTGSEGEFFKLVKFESNGDATWQQIDVGSSGPGVDTLRDQVNAVVDPDASGNIDIDGVTVANAANPSSIPVETVASTNKLDVQVQVSAAINGAPGDKNDAGLCSFDDSYFTVDTDGYTSLTTLLANIGSLGGNGFISQTSATTVANRTFTVGTASGLSLTNADGVSGNPIINYTGGPDVLGRVHNLSISYSSPTLSVQSADGSALSSTNIASCAFNETDGTIIRINKTSNESIEDASGTSNIVGNLFGTTTSRAWGNVLPFYLYAVCNDNRDEWHIFLSRMPHHTKAPASTEIGTPASAIADKNISFFCLSSITTTEYDGNPATLIGCIRATKDASDDWTFATMTTADGIGRFHEGTMFTFPTGQNGAASGSYMTNLVASTLPTFASQVYTYTVKISGVVYLRCNAVTVNNTPAGTDTIFLSLPIDDTNQSFMVISNTYWDDGGVPIYDYGSISIGVSNQFFRLYDQNGTGVNSTLSNAELASGDSIYYAFIYTLDNIT
ncbi:MAG: hypothetical protein R3230_01330 [Nitrosopumilaceae archaeon]|nr:hypothetical protein [Nitrosopumilaceae archaeon]